MVTRVAVQSRGPRNTHREVTYLQLGSPAICMRVAVCLHMQTNGLLYLLPTPNTAIGPGFRPIFIHIQYWNTKIFIVVIIKMCCHPFDLMHTVPPMVHTVHPNTSS